MTDPQFQLLKLLAQHGPQPVNLLDKRTLNSLIRRGWVQTKWQDAFLLEAEIFRTGREAFRKQKKLRLANVGGIG
jgi:hypothetical protein